MKYAVYGKVRASKFLGTFEAESAEKAIEMALNSDAAYVSVCHQCSRDIEDPEIDEATAEEEE
jgi:hypothetical protein